MAIPAPDSERVGVAHPEVRTDATARAVPGAVPAFRHSGTAPSRYRGEEGRRAHPPADTSTMTGMWSLTSDHSSYLPTVTFSIREAHDAGTKQ